MKEPVADRSPRSDVADPSVGSVPSVPSVPAIPSTALLEEARRQDALLRALGLTLWIGAEPTFTRPESQDPCWVGIAEGGDKESTARALLLAIVPRMAPGARVFRALGRQYPDEAKPRFAFGAHWRRMEMPDGAGGAGAASGAPSPLVASLDEDPPIECPISDPSFGWLTVTPDPGVVEVNMAPAPDLETFLAYSRAVYAAATDAGLSAVRYRYNGHATDSGGGGQITFGGPTAEQSPFFARPQTLPAFLRYLNRHPSLSYWFAMDCIGSASQGPRPDEGVRERFEELSVALDRLTARGDALGPAELWEALAPLLVDGSGNSHRAEVNVEKLWNPHLPGRGMLGLVELRSLRMEPTAERMVAIAALFRAVIARLAMSASDAVAPQLVDWGRGLHDRYALPYFLLADLREVLADLEAAGLGLGPAVTELLVAPRADIARVRMGDAWLTVTPALEFWALVGDVASQERSGARIVDASAERVQVVIDVPVGDHPGHVGAFGWEVPLLAVREAEGRALYLAGLRYRAFVPHPGFHPGLGPHDPLVLYWERAEGAVRVAMHQWIPGGGVYDGLPRDGVEAERRRRERVVVEEAAREELRAGPVAGGGITFDLRRVQG